jgi:Ner family transcriptional regulator
MAKPKADKSAIEIQFMLNSAGWTYAAVDRAHRLRPGIAKAAAHKPCAPGETAIARVLDLPAHRIWPSRYDAQGNRLKPQPTANYKPKRLFPHRQKGQAA